MHCKPPALRESTFIASWMQQVTDWQGSILYLKEQYFSQVQFNFLVVDQAALSMVGQLTTHFVSKLMPERQGHPTSKTPREPQVTKWCCRPSAALQVHLNMALARGICVSDGHWGERAAHYGSQAPLGAKRERGVRHGKKEQQGEVLKWKAFYSCLWVYVCGCVTAWVSSKFPGYAWPQRISFHVDICRACL